MFQRTLEDNRPSQAFRPINNLALWPDKFQLRVLTFQLFFVINRLGVIWTQIRQDCLHLRNNITSLKNNHRIAPANVESSNFISIMQTSVLNGRPGNLHWIKYRHWSCRTSPTNRNHDIFDNRRSFFGGKLERHSRPWSFANCAELGVCYAIIEFYHRTVSIERQIFTNLTQVIYIIHDLIKSVNHLSLPTSRDTKLLHHLVAKSYRRCVL